MSRGSRCGLSRGVIRRHRNQTNTQMKHVMHDVGGGGGGTGGTQGTFIINKESNTHTSTENCSVLTEPAVGSGVPHSPERQWEAHTGGGQFVLCELP